MGGTAYVIHGKIDPQRLDRPPSPKTVLDRLTGRNTPERPKFFESPERKYVTIPSQSLSTSMKKAFRAFIRREIPKPHESTRSLLDYVSVCNASFCGESEVGASELDWYFQFNFKGCAGEAEVAAELGWHWMHLWMQREFDMIAQNILISEGFAPTETHSVQNGSTITFLPLKHYGHAACRFDDVPIGQPPHFELEAFVYECGGESEDGLDHLMQKHFGPLMADRLCRCQLCMPSFAPVEIDFDVEFDMDV